VKLPIRTRLTLFYCAVFSVSTALLETGVYAGLRASVVAEVDSDLRSRLVEVEGKLSKHPVSSPLSRLQNDLNTHETLHPRFLEVRELGGRLIFVGPGMDQLPGQAPGPVPSIKTVHTRASPLRVLAGRWRVRHIDYEILVATDLAPPLQILQIFGLIVLLSSPVVLACASIAGYWISGRALAPVTEIATAARSIGAAELSRRVESSGNGDELQFLAETVNGMLSRIEDAFRHISQFTANASHELRTPVALIRSAAEVALLREPEDIETYREALHRILSEAQRNTILLDDMLSLAKADAGTLSCA
jgi:signal transduction histidine kinase